MAIVVRPRAEHAFVANGRPKREFTAVKRLLDSGLSDYAVGRMLGIPRSTVRNYRLRDDPPIRRVEVKVSEPWRPEDPEAYCYLLGLYLGDGCLIMPPRGSPRLTVTLDVNYPLIIDEAARAIARVAPTARILRSARIGRVALVAAAPIWLDAFPQHGPGRKHRRTIELLDWQTELTAAEPAALIRGLIHSDGSRCINRVKTRLPSGRCASYEYVRYFFTNYSADIRGIFCDHCDQVGIRWTQSSFKNISIANRPSVAILDRFVGPKR